MYSVLEATRSVFEGLPNYHHELICILLFPISKAKVNFIIYLFVQCLLLIKTKPKILSLQNTLAWVSQVMGKKHPCDILKGVDQLN